MVKFLFRQTVKAQSCHANHLSKFAGGQNNIDILIAGRIHLRSLAFIFFGDTRHYRYYKHFLSRNPHLICIIGLCNRTKHLLWRFAGGNVIQQVRVVLLHKVNPARATGGNHRQRASIFHPVEQLIAFLHNGQVGRKVGVEYLIKTQTSERSNHLAGCNCASFHSKLFTDCNTNSRSGLNDDKFIRVVDGIPNSLGVVLFIQCADWANCHTLSAVDTRRFRERLFKGGSDFKIDRTTGEADGIGRLNRLTSLHTASATNTLGHIAYQRRIAHLLWYRLPDRVEDVAADIVLCCKFL